jgi:hypothetical protein
MHLAEIVLAMIGLGLLAASLFMYQTRTHDEKFFTRFWLGKDLLTFREYVLNRLGFVLTVAVILAASVRLAYSLFHR